MRNLSSFERFVNESYLEGPRAPLYHVTSVSNAINIMKDDTLMATDPRGISITRDSNFKYDNNPITFVLDGEKLSNIFKIRPYNYWSKGHSKGTEEHESEEIINIRAIKNLSKYVLEIQIDLPYMEAYKNGVDQNDEGPNEFMDYEYEAFWETLSEYRDCDGRIIRVTDEKGNTLDPSLFEGIYNDLLGATRMFVSRSADSPDDVDVYYSLYAPGVSSKNFGKNQFLDHLDKHGIRYRKTGGNKVTMSKSELERMKKSLFNLEQ